MHFLLTSVQTLVVFLSEETVGRLAAPWLAQNDRLRLRSSPPQNGPPHNPGAGRSTFCGSSFALALPLAKIYLRRVTDGPRD